MVDYQKLLDVFFSSHNPANKPYSRQYMSLVLYDSAEQKSMAEATILKLRERRGSIHTKVDPFSRFFLAEAYHQKYYLSRVSSLNQELTGRYKTLEEFLTSPVVTRINGYVGGYGTLSGLKSELEQFGLTEKASDRLVEIVSSR